jgi:DNA gyrase subunit B
MSTEYNSSNIKILEGLEAVRKRPGMYIGNTGVDGLHHLIWEISDNSVDEAGAGFGKKIIVSRSLDNVITIIDEGRGIPVDKHESGKSALEVIFTVLHAGGKFDSETYKTSGGLHGVGASVTNALSEWLEVTVSRNNKKYFQRFERGNPVSELKIIGESKTTGTKVSFKPDILIFKNGIEFINDRIENRLNELAFLNKGISFVFKYEDSSGWKEKEFVYNNGLLEFVSFEKKGEKELYKPIYISGNEFETEVELSFTHLNKGFDQNIKSFVNNIRTHEAGSHETGTLTGLFSALQQQMREKDIKKSDSLKIEDFKEGIICIVSVKVIEPEFEGQTKGRLNDSNARRATFQIAKEKFYYYLEENPKIFKDIVKKMQTAQKAREAAKKSREMVRKTEMDKGLGILPSKLADCQSNKASDCELFLVEGDSAGGSAKQGRNRKTQAILPFKGKVLNAFKQDMSKILSQPEVSSLITALGCGVGKNFDIDKLRYDKIIIMTDADVDGDHISFLFFLIFFKLFRPLLENGNIYLSIPPLYRVKKSDKVFYFEDYQEMFDFFKLNFKGRFTKNLTFEDISKGWIVTRFKGLGEMNPAQLSETAMNPETRKIVQITLPKENEEISSQEILELLGGADTKFRHWFLMKYTSEVDI